MIRVLLKKVYVLVLCFVFIFELCTVSVGVQAQTIEKIYTDANGNIRLVPYPVPASLLNTGWTSQMEDDFWVRINKVINYSKTNSYRTTWQEEEKHAYPLSMISFIADPTKRGVEKTFLESDDYQTPTDHFWTYGVDFYYGFTNWWNPAKYFWFGKFGKYLDSSYLNNKFLPGAKEWSKTDPEGRKHPNPNYPVAGASGWGPNVTDKCADTRDTDNLYLMRDVAAYLFAEETGNTDNVIHEKDLIKQYISSLFNVGMSEWDSANYMGHGITTLLNLYDYAQDYQVRSWAKAGLDWMMTAGALKYYKGAYAGPNKRNYGRENAVLSSSLSQTLYTYFGDVVETNPILQDFQIRLAMSAYRPPLAVIELAKKNFARPVEMINTKGAYGNYWMDQNTPPESWETMFIGINYQFGSLVSAGSNSDASPFKLVADNTSRGADYFLAYTSDLNGNGGQEEGQQPYSAKRKKDEISQFRNLGVYLRPADTSYYYIMAPNTATFEIDSSTGNMFFKYEKTWIAVRPINIAFNTTMAPADPLYNHETVYRFTSISSSYIGFAMEVSDNSITYDQFKTKINTQASIDKSQLSSGKVTLTGIDGNVLGVTYNNSNDKPIITRNGQIYNWDTNLDIYKPIDSDSPLTLNWHGRTITVKAGGSTFTETFSVDNIVSFSPMYTTTPTPIPTPTPTPPITVGSTILNETERLDTNFYATSTSVTDINIYDPICSGNSYNNLKAAANGDYVEYTINIPTKGTYSINTGNHRANNRGIYQLSIAGTNFGGPVDLYSSSPGVSEINLGQMYFETPGDYVFRYTCSGANGSSGGRLITLDYIKLTFDATTIVTPAPTPSPTPAPVSVPVALNFSDIGTPALTGSFTNVNGTITESGAGSDIYYTSDQFGYASQVVVGNSSISTKVISQTNSNAWAKAGVMLRESIDANSPFVDLLVSPGNGLSIQWRSKVGGSASNLSLGSYSFPVYLKLIRTGNIFNAYKSNDGINWGASIGNCTIDMNSSITAGLCVSSHNVSALSTAVFDSIQLTSSVAVTPTPTPIAWVSNNIGSPAISGSFTNNSGIITVTGAGSDIYYTSDQCMYVNHPVTGNSSISSQIVSQTNTNGWAKAGLMFRESINANCAFVNLLVTPSNGIDLQWRSATGGSATRLALGNYSFPVYLKLTRTGNIFNAYKSSDGINWGTSLGSCTVTMNSIITVGLSVTSHNIAATSSVVYQQVQIISGS